MKKTAFLFYFILFCINSFAQTKTTKVTYKLAIGDNLISEELSSKYTKAQLEAIKIRYANYNILEYTLLFNSSESLFYLNDIEIGLISDFENNKLKNILKTEKKKKYYKNLKSDKIVFATSLGGENLLITGKTNQIKWKLTSKNKIIGKNTCYKAILIEGNKLLGFNQNMIIEAWYTPEIPVPFGPLHFEGLPGLILELSLGPKTYYASSIKYNTNNVIEELVDGKVITRERYSSIIEKFAEEMFTKN